MIHRRDTRKEILNQALNIYAEYGYAKMTLALIAQNVGIKKPSIYAHFSNKDEIFLVLLEQQFKEINNFLDYKILNICTTYDEETLHSEIFKRIILYIIEDPIRKKFWHKIFFNAPLNFKKNIEVKLEAFAEKFINSMINTFELDNHNYKSGEEMKITIIRSFIAYIFGIISLLIYNDKTITLDELEVFGNIYINGLVSKMNFPISK